MEKYGQSKATWRLTARMYSFFIIMLCCAIACNSKTDDPSVVVKKWKGKKISFPSGIPCNRLGENIPCEQTTAKYKVLLYTDSIACVSCNLRIDEWKKLIAEAKDTSPGLLSFLFYFNPKKGEDLANLFKKENFREQVFMDKEDLLNRQNRFPGQMPYQCFLLNSNDEIVLVGNPTLNSNIRKLYTDLIHGRYNPEQE